MSVGKFGFRTAVVLGLSGALALDAFLGDFLSLQPTVDTGSLEGDLRESLTSWAHAVIDTPTGRTLVRLVAEAQLDKQLATAWSERSCGSWLLISRKTEPVIFWMQWRSADLLPSGPPLRACLRARRSPAIGVLSMDGGPGMDSHCCSLTGASRRLLLTH